MLSRSNIIQKEVNKEMKTSFIAYAMAVNVSRAIPDVRDGLKPVHRRILYAMNELGLSADKPYRKCARIVGDVLGKYHPHGDSAVYEALVRLAQDFSIRCTLVDGHGNFGSVDGDPPAAQRYTEARLSKIAGEMLRDIDKKTVDYYPNFDDTLEQPVVLPSRFPNVLVNGSDGIAVGMATSIPPHNLGEVIDGTIALLDNPDITIDELMDIIPAPDYPTGALIMGKSGIKKAYRTGRGIAILRARAEIEEFNNGTRSRIVVTEIPYQVNKAKLIETIAELVKQKKIEGISDVQEESDRDGMRVVIDIKKDANPQVVLNMLYKHTNMQISNSMIMLALVDGRPKILNLKEILEAYVRHQKSVIVRRTQYDLDKALEKEHILLGLVKALANIDEVIAIIKSSEDKTDAANKLTEAFELSQKQANAILEMKLQRLSHLEVEKLNAELGALEKDIAEYRAILASEERVIEIIKTEMTEIKNKYSTPRKSEITYDFSSIDIEDLIEQEDIIVSMTHFGYIKRMPISEYRAQHRGGTGVQAHKTKDEDFVENLFMTNTHEPLLFFTNRGKVYRIKAYEIPESSRTAKGRAIVNLLNLTDGEKVNAFMPLPTNTQGYLMLATKQGLIKKTKLEEFASIRNDGKIAITLNDGDELISAQITGGEDELLLASSGGKCIRFAEQGVRPTGRTSQGVKSISLDDNESVVDMTIVKDGAEVMTLTENGFGKRTDISEYRLQSRGGKGIKVGTLNDKTGNIVNLKLVTPDDDIMIISDNGTIIRINASEISKIGRSTQGVRVMRMKGDESKVCSFTVVPRMDEDTLEKAEEENIKNDNASMSEEIKHSESEEDL
ncbi:MAG: DNA gyrase subunit A [Clostridia bacterium]|nr:DNA gyrase subunit A [Clostridia bacterium]